MYETYQQVWKELTSKGAPFHVEEIEVRGSPMRVYSAAPPSLREIWLASALHNEAEYLVYGDERWSYKQAHANAAAVANWLKQNNVHPGDRVAIAMRNFPEWLLCYWACVATGITVVGMNAWWVEDEMEYGLNDANPKVIFTDSERLEDFFIFETGFLISLPSASDCPKRLIMLFLSTLSLLPAAHCPRSTLIQTLMPAFLYLWHDRLP